MSEDASKSIHQRPPAICAAASKPNNQREKNANDNASGGERRIVPHCEAVGESAGFTGIIMACEGCGIDPGTRAR
jgi:hypothetical protein